MFLLQVSNYGNPALDTETPKLLHQRLEEHSRWTISWMWKVTVRLNAHVADGTGAGDAADTLPYIWRFSAGLGYF